LPLRRIISYEMLLRYKAMQVDVFALVAEARQRIASNTAAIAADRDFWVADSDLRAVIAGGIAAPAAEPSSPALARPSPSQSASTSLPPIGSPLRRPSPIPSSEATSGASALSTCCRGHRRKLRQRRWIDTLYCGNIGISSPRASQ